MRGPDARRLDRLWARHNAEWRDCAQVASQWRDAADIDPQLLRAVVRGAWWETLARARLTLLLTREYENFQCRDVFDRCHSFCSSLSVFG